MSSRLPPLLLCSTPSTLPSLPFPSTRRSIQSRKSFQKPNQAISELQEYVPLSQSQQVSSKLFSFLKLSLKSPDKRQWKLRRLLTDKPNDQAGHLHISKSSRRSASSKRDSHDCCFNVSKPFRMKNNGTYEGGSYELRLFCTLQAPSR